MKLHPEIFVIISEHETDWTLMIMTWFCRYIMTFQTAFCRGVLIIGFTWQLFTLGLLVIINGLFDWLLDTFGGCCVSRVLQPSLVGTARSVMQQWKWPQTLAQHLRKTTILTWIKQSLKWLQIKQVSSDATSFTCIIATEAVETRKTCLQHDSSYCSQHHPSADVNPAFFTPMKD